MFGNFSFCYTRVVGYGQVKLKLHAYAWNFRPVYSFSTHLMYFTYLKKKSVEIDTFIHCYGLEIVCQEVSLFSIRKLRSIKLVISKYMPPGSLQSLSDVTPINYIN